MTSQTLGDTLIAERACCRLVRLVVETWNVKELKVNCRAVFFAPWERAVDYGGKVRPRPAKLTIILYLVLRGYPPVRTRLIARGLICSALNRFSLAGDCHSPYSLGSLCDGQFCSGRPHLPPVVTRLPCFSPSGSSVGLLVHLLPRITKSSTSMEATYEMMSKN